MLGDPNPEAQMESLLNRRSDDRGYPNYTTFEALLDAKLKTLEWTIYLKLAMAFTWLIALGSVFYALLPPRR
jgi:hypothetical protein